MPRGLRRIHGGGNLHFITTSCYQREPLLGSARARDVFLEIFEQVRRRYDFEVIGYVVMPEHTGVPSKRRCCGCWGGRIHVLISEPKRDTVSIVVQLLKQRAAHRLLQKSKPSLQRELWETMRPRFWQRRYYDFNVYSDGKVTEKLRYMHRNPVERGLVPSPELWRWSSYRAFAFCEEGVVKLNWQRRSTNGKAKAVAASGAADSIAAHPPKVAEGRAPTLWVRPRKTR